MRLTFVVFFQLQQPRGCDGGALRPCRTDIGAAGALRPCLAVRSFSPSGLA